MVLAKMNFDTKFSNAVNALFLSQQAYVTDTGLVSEPFKVERGVRQGDPLSPLLYTLAIEPLLRRLHDSINGINIKNQEFKIAAYADDLTIGIGSQDDWLKFMEATKVYEAASNAKVNKSKTVLVPLTTAAQGLNLPGEDEFKRLTEGEPIAILGYKVDGRGNPIKRLWEDLAGTIQDKIKSMANRNLSFKGRILISKSLFISKMWYLAYLVPPKRKQLYLFNNIIMEWIKNRSRMLPRYSTFQQGYDQGGLAAPILKDALDARLITVFIKLWTSDSFWAKAERAIITENLQNKRNITIKEALNSSTVTTKGWPERWKPYILAWNRLEGQVLGEDSGSWDPGEFRIGNQRGSYSVKDATEYLRSKVKPSPSQSEHADWIKEKWTINRKKEVAWRLNFRALPLGYRLIHSNQEESGECPACPGEIQTPLHFALEYRVSKMIWTEAYKCLVTTDKDRLPLSWDEIFSASNIEEIPKRKAAIWVHITCLYEIWCWYTQVKWGQKQIPETVLPDIIRMRLNNELKILNAMKEGGRKGIEGVKKYLILRVHG